MRVSIVVPVHNQETNLDRCVTSLLNQSHQDIEVVLVENGSSDHSLDICNDFAHGDDRVSVIRLDRAGVSLARNAGIQRASGPLLMFCDSDDWVDPDWVGSMHDCLLGGNFDLAVGGYTRIKDHESSERGLDRAMPQDACVEWLNQRDFYLLERWGLLNAPWNKIYRRDIIVCRGLEFDPSISISEDMLFNLNYLATASRIGLVHGCAYNYRVSMGGTLSSSYVPGEWEVATRVRSEFEALLKRVPGGWSAYGQEFWSVYLDILERIIHRRAGEAGPCTLKSMVRDNNTILGSPEARQIFEGADWGARNPMYIRALKTRNYIWVWLYRITTSWIAGFRCSLRRRASWG